MNQYILEIVRQKWRHLSIVLFLIILNVIMTVFVSAFQIPSLADLQTNWSNLRNQSARSGKVDAATLYQQGAVDLEKLNSRIPKKREFARVLSELFESASSNAVVVGTITYKPVEIKEEALLSYQLSLSLSGSYAAVKSFLADLQNNPDLLVIDTAAFSNNDLFVENVVMNVQITVYLREGA
jgi:type IV pilus assembly protein PilO